jgi:hypothetical protein
MPTQANRPLGDGYQQQNHRMRKVLPCAGGECDKVSVVAVTWE